MFVSLCLFLIIGLFTESERAVSRFGRTVRDLGEITSSLKLTDISFSNDARYTRNPSQSDVFSAFQDYPGSIEHFPSGSVIATPDFDSLGTKMIIRDR
jgi:hypothetical protein